VVVLAALGEPPDPALDGDLREAVASLAEDWARAVAAEGRAYVTDAEPAALAELLAGHEGPLIVVAPDVPRLDAALAHAALSDLAAGCVLSFAPATDAKAYLLAFADTRPEALALLSARDRRREALFAEAMALGDEVGLLRSERRVVTPADARALALDPLVPEPLRLLAARHG
jgi:hypothetical protein